MNVRPWYENERVVAWIGALLLGMLAACVVAFIVGVLIRLLL